MSREIKMRYTQHIKAWPSAFGVVLLLLVSASGLLAQGMPPARIVAALVDQAKIRQTAEVVGTIVPLTEGTVSSETPGLVTKMHVKQGDRVTKGQVICQMRDTSLKLLLDEAQATLESMKQTLAELEAGTRKEDMDRLKAVAAEAEAIKERWDHENARVEGLYESKVASLKEYQDTVAEWAASTQRLAQCHADLAKAIAGPRKEVLARARARILAQQARARQIQDRIGKMSIKAPYTGYIIRKLTEVGQWVRIGGSVVDMLAVDQVLARVNLPEKSIAFVKVGDSATVLVDAVDREYSGKVAHIIPKADVAARAFPVEIEIDNQNGAIKPGMFVRAILPGGPEIDSLIVPKDAVIRQGPMRVVHVIRNGRAVAEFVKVGLEKGDRISVFGNLKKGDAVVVRGNERLAPIPGGVPVVVTNAKELGLPVEKSNQTPPDKKK